MQRLFRGHNEPTAAPERVAVDTLLTLAVEYHMRKLLHIGIAVALTLGTVAPAVALAAPSGWKDAADCQVPPDHGVWDNSNTVLVGCITDEAWKQAATASAADQAKLGQYMFPANTTKRGSNGVLYGCFVGQPWFFTFSCILPPEAR